MNGNLPKALSQPSQSYKSKRQVSPSLQYPDSVDSNEKEGIKNSEKTQGSWTNEENLTFSVFIDLHQAIFTSVENRKSTKIYTYMSKYMKKRSAQQCRSHFQKILLKFGNIHAFIARMKRIYGEIAYKQMFEECPIAHQALQSIGQSFSLLGISEAPKKKDISTQTDKTIVFSESEYQKMMSQFEMKLIQQYRTKIMEPCFTFHPIYYPFN